MKWTKLTFGKYAGKTFPQIAFHDPDWLFWILEQHTLCGPLVLEATNAERQATRIKLKHRKPGTYEFEWVFDKDGRFNDVEVIKIYRYSENAPERGRRTRFLDLSVLRSHKGYDKRGYKRLMKRVRHILFGDEDRRMTKKRCEAFFSDRRNFG